MLVEGNFCKDKLTFRICNVCNVKQVSSLTHKRRESITTQTDKLTIRDTEVENVEQFTYLGSIISTTGGTDEDIKARKRKAQQAFAMLKPVWRSTTLRTSTKLRLFNSNNKIKTMEVDRAHTEKGK